MKRGLIILLAVLAFSAAMVPRVRRSKKICAPQTPCGWSVYKPKVRIIEYNVTNNYCECSPNMVCQVDEDDESTLSLVKRCRHATV